MFCVAASVLVCSLLVRTNVFVDGFNLCYGALKGSAYRWLDLHALARKFLPKHEINRIRYFTARVASGDGDAQQPLRQQVSLPER